MFDSTSLMFCLVQVYSQPNVGLNHTKSQCSHDTSGISSTSIISNPILSNFSHPQFSWVKSNLLTMTQKGALRSDREDRLAPRCLGRVRRSCDQGVPKPSFSSAGHRKTIGKPWENADFTSNNCDFMGCIADL